VSNECKILIESVTERSIIDTFSVEAREKNYFEREDIILPDEEMVMSVAENWSINPSALESRNYIMPALGLLGE
jgi:hypothetical protein